MKFPAGKAAILAVAGGLILALPTTILLGARLTPATASPTPSPGLTQSLTPSPALTRIPMPSPALTRRPTPATPSPTATLTPAPTAMPTPTSPPSGTLPVFSHVFIIVMENHEYGGIIGNPAAAYINSLAASYGLATNYFAISHPSLPNYLAMVAGSTFGIASDCTQCFVTAPNIVDQVEQSGRSWKAYLEGMPSPCYLGSSAGNYAQKHNPFVYFTGLRNDPGRCSAHVAPFSQFSVDLAGTVPNYVWITPDMCNEMHDCSVETGDAWLRAVVPSILNSSAYRDRGVLFITFDEGSTGAGCCGVAAGGQVVTLVISPMARSAFRSGAAQTHYSLLRTIEDSWQLGRLGGAAAAVSMREYFR